MKSKLVILFLFLAFNGIAQSKDILELIKETNNKKLVTYVENQDKIFNELENYLSEIAQQEFNAKNDSINCSKFMKLLEYYNQLNKNIPNLYKAPKSKSQQLLVASYMINQMTTIDNLYAEFTSKRFEEKVDSKANNSVDNFNGVLSFIEKKPVHESCSGSENEDFCTADFIRKKIGKNYNLPDFRDFSGQKFRIQTDFVVKKNGTLTNISNSKSSGHFEYDMEAISVFYNSFSDEKFIPGEQNGKPVNCKYRLPITIDIPK